MNRILITAVMLASLIRTAGAEEFYLRHDGTGKVYGPYVTDSGSKVVIGKTTFTVVQTSSGMSAVEKRLAAVTIPSMSVAFAPIQTVVEHLQSMIQDQDPKTQNVTFVFPPKESKKKKLSDLQSRASLHA